MNNIKLTETLSCSSFISSSVSSSPCLTGPVFLEHPTETNWH